MAQTQQVIEIFPGQTVVLPSGARIDSYVTSGDAEVTSSCNNLPTEDEYACIQFSLAESEAGGSGGAVESGTIESIKIGGTTYEIGSALDDPIIDAVNTINNAMDPILQIYSWAYEEYSDRKEWVLGARVPSLLVDTIQFKLTATGFTGGIIVPHEEVADCGCVTTFSGTPTSSSCDT